MRRDGFQYPPATVNISRMSRSTWSVYVCLYSDKIEQ